MSEGQVDSALKAQIEEEVVSQFKDMPSIAKPASKKLNQTYDKPTIPEPTQDLIEN